jgi:predicted RNA binding protein YcfA (HicA-like mRNA interferase family)
MRLPRNISGQDLARRLSALGYEITRQTGSHMRLTTQEHGEHHVTIPLPTRPACIKLRATLIAAWPGRSGRL